SSIAARTPNKRSRRSAPADARPDAAIASLTAGAGHHENSSMGSGDRRGTRTGRRSRTKRSASTKRAQPDAGSVYPHPVFGPIPLLVREWLDADGAPRAGYEFDPDYQP